MMDPIDWRNYLTLPGGATVGGFAGLRLIGAGTRKVVRAIKYLIFGYTVPMPRKWPEVIPETVDSPATDPDPLLDVE